MFRSWSKEDRNHYGSSEVMQELEKSVFDTLKRLDILHRRASAEGAPSVDSIDPSVERSVNSLSSSLNGLAGSLGNVADAAAASDDVLDDPDDEDSNEDVKASVISDLKDLVKSAIEKDDIVLAYKIERTIEEILEEEY
jgi:hypothetical protein